MNLEKHIFTLLQQHDCVIVPEFGGFIANFEPASIQQATHTILPPRKYLVFNSNLIINDGLLATEVGGRMGCSFEKAMNLIRQEVVAWRETLNTGKSITLDGIGDFQVNKTGKFEFKPDPDQNFFDEAYGLTALVVPPLKKRSRKTKPKKLVYHRPVRKTTVRIIRRVAWAAAITIPLVAAGIWSMTNFDTLRHFAFQHSGFFIPVRINSNDPAENVYHYKPETHLPAPQPVLEAISLPEDAFLTVEEESGANESVDSGEPGTTEVEESPVTSPETTDCEPVSITGRSYYIIVGSFENEFNAQLLTDELIAQGWKSKVIDSSQGMYRVSIASCADKLIALQQLATIREEKNPNAWLLRI